jgi:hypothetical protein
MAKLRSARKPYGMNDYFTWYKTPRTDDFFIRSLSPLRNHPHGALQEGLMG